MKFSELHKTHMSENHTDVAGKNNPWYGKHHSEETKNKIRLSKLGRGHSERTKQKMSLSRRGSDNMFYGKHHSIKSKQKMSNAHTGLHHSEETKRKIREYRLGKVYPNFNPFACQLIDEYGQKHGYHFQHALNGGEVRVIGYSLDGYDKKKNVVIEYYEKYHNKSKVKIRDAQRKKEIVKHLGCKFIEIREEL